MNERERWDAELRESLEAQQFLRREATAALNERDDLRAELGRYRSAVDAVAVLCERRRNFPIPANTILDAINERLSDGAA